MMVRKAKEGIIVNRIAKETKNENSF